MRLAAADLIEAATSDREVAVKIERNQGLLDKDFQLFYTSGDKELGFTTLTQRPVPSDKGYFLPFMGQVQPVTGVRSGDSVRFALPAITRGAVFWYEE